MIAIENEKILNVCHVCGYIDFTPKLTYSFDSTSNKLTVTDGSNFTSSDPFQIVNIRATVEGNVRCGSIDTLGGSVEIDLSELNTSNGFNITASIVSKGRQIVDLAAYEVASKIGSANGVIVKDKVN